MGLDPTRPDSTRAYFWPAVNKRPTRLWPGYFPTRPEAIFFDPKGKKLKNLTFLGEIFWILTQTINGWPDPTRVKIFWPGPITSANSFVAFFYRNLSICIKDCLYLCLSFTSEPPDQYPPNCVQTSTPTQERFFYNNDPANLIPWPRAPKP